LPSRERSTRFSDLFTVAPLQSVTRVPLFFLPSKPPEINLSFPARAFRRVLLLRPRPATFCPCETPGFPSFSPKDLGQPALCYLLDCIYSKMPFFSRVLTYAFYSLGDVRVVSYSEPVQSSSQRRMRLLQWRTSSFGVFFTLPDWSFFSSKGKDEVIDRYSFPQLKVDD